MPSVSEITIKTPRHTALVDITSRIQHIMRGSGVQSGTVVAFVPHTTAALTINENADPDSMNDLLAQLDQMVPWNQPFYRHAEGNSAAHVKCSLLGSSETVLIDGGRLLLGTWQSIYLAEFDGPRSRRVLIQIVPR